jgi:hypothetical protein
MRVQRTLLLVGALVTTPIALAAGPGTYLGMGANSPPAANTSALAIGGAGGASVGNQPVPSPNSRALDTANATFTDRQIGIERAQTDLSVQGIERRRDAEQLESRSRRGASALTPSAGLPVPPIASAPTTPITPTEASGATVTR